ncbi:magnesium transporter [Balneola sp. EhC07]|jgi:magnesium transporter|uniref:magnesium transporter n=1 Tax=Balneola sp. EhC07 TaxID=1849360 RepID=UPI0007F3852C|nr:magnesium transporter [Balneola sp. EhC07]OAN64407.1 magnesium transporter [Balneola sp. EhC07]|tara:strand:+ start:212 stop:1594 length:1383 start_codon:yes stop_codon:yes gene_type:complete
MLVQLIKPEFEELIQAKDWVALKDVLADVPAADIADLLVELEGDVAVVIFRLLKKPLAADVFSALPSGKGVELLELFNRQQLSDVMVNLEPDEQVSLMEELPGHLTQRVMNSMNLEDQKQVKKLLGYPEESVGRLMTPRYVRVKTDWTIERSMKHIRKYAEVAETLNRIYVVDDKEYLIDDLRLTELILADPEETIETLMDRSFETLMAYEDQEEAVKMFAKYDRAALPVVDTDGILVGIVTVDDVIDVAEEEATEDMQKMAGMDALDDYYSQTTVGKLVKKRITWLIVLFVGQILTALTMSGYEEVLQKIVLLSYFVPLLIASGGNSGSQAATLIIRALATDDIKSDGWKMVLKKEGSSGLMLGSILGVLGFATLIVWGLIDGDPMNMELVLKASVVASSLLLIVVFGNVIGAMLPFILSKVGLDPAVSSAPFVATIVDVSGIIIYFSIAVFLLSGILL